MKFVILHVLCEGQTEERFVKKVLSPYLLQYNVFPKAILLLTSKKKNARGGMLSYAQAKRDMEILMRQFRDNDSECHLFTTMFDYYSLPDDFPGFPEVYGIKDVRERVAFIEMQFCDALGKNHRLIPYIQLHEFEALLFADIERLNADYPLAVSGIGRLKAEADRYGDPEMIDNGRATAPSKRIKKALEKEYNYNKVKSGASTASLIGMETIIERCRHFREWITAIKESAKSLT